MCLYTNSDEHVMVNTEGQLNISGDPFNVVNVLQFNSMLINAIRIDIVSMYSLLNVVTCT